MRATGQPEGDTPIHCEGELRSFAPLAVGLGATTLIHSVIGACTAGTILVVCLLRPLRHLNLGIAAVGVAAAIALPQALSMIGIALPPAGGLANLSLAAATALALSITVVRRWLRLVVWIGLTGALLLAIWQLPRLASAAGSWGASFLSSIPVLGVMAGVSLLVASSLRGMPVLWAGLLIGALAGAVAYAIPSDTPSLLLHSIRFEIPKEVHSWTPMFMALAAAVGIRELLAGGAGHRPKRWQSAHRVLGPFTVAIFIQVATLPVRLQPIDPLHVGEHRVSENLAIHLRHAERGFWVGYLDSRMVVEETPTGDPQYGSRPHLDGRYRSGEPHSPRCAELPALGRNPDWCLYWRPGDRGQHRR